MASVAVAAVAQKSVLIDMGYSSRFGVKVPLPAVRGNRRLSRQHVVRAGSSSVPGVVRTLFGARADDDGIQKLVVGGQRGFARLDPVSGQDERHDVGVLL